MSEIILIHNPKCSKSRKTLELLNEKNIELKIIKYLEEPLSVDLLTRLISALAMKPKDVLRTKEEEYKALSLDLDNDEQVINAIIKTPKILERPIVMKNNMAVIGRPPENIEKLF